MVRRTTGLRILHYRVNKNPPKIPEENTTISLQIDERESKKKLKT